MKKKFYYSLLGCLLFCTQQASTQMALTTEHSDTTVSLNKTYNKVGSVKRIFLGHHYRKEWATPVDIEILDLNSFAGGLTPVKLGGGLQTKSLRMQGADGRLYVLRSVNKDVSKAMIEELKKTFAEDIVADQVSSANPYAPLVVATLAQSAGIYHSTPKIVYVENSDRLGEYAKSFAETVCLIEERPKDDESDNAAFGFSKNIINTEKLFEKVFSNNNHRVDETAYIKARLFDMLIGDWDRHEDQWLWASFKEDGKTIYKPIPRDRDQAFPKLDGLIPQSATRKWGVRNIQNFDYTIRDVNGLNKSGGHLDRNFTTRLTLKDWLEVAEELQDSITNKAIADAFREMPDAIYNISGQETVAKLKRRRDDLKKYAKSYYLFLSQQVNITGTNEKEYFEVTRINSDSTSVTVYRANKDDEWGREVFSRTFLSSETNEIRLYGLGGNDLYEVKGKTKKGILVRVIGGKGEDTITDKSVVKESGNQTKVYDDKQNVFNTGKETKNHISADTLKNNYNRKSYKFDWLAPVLTPGYNVDDGFFVGGGLIFKKQGFGKAPYSSMQTIVAHYAANTGAFSTWYKGTFREFIGKADLNVSVKYNSPKYTRNYYGLGNETIIDETKDNDYYNVRISQFSIATSMSRQLGKHHTLTVGNEFQTIRLEESSSRFVTSSGAKLDSSDFDRKKYTNFQVAYQFNTLDNALFPTNGVKIDVGGKFTQNLVDKDQHFVQAYTEAAFYSSVGRLTIASRSGAATNLNDEYEFFQAHTLGGLNNLRGYHRDRFAGKTAVYQNTELRFNVSNVNAYFAKGMWGVLAFADHGRVWIPGEESDLWHHGYGGGLYFLPFNKMALTATYGVSKEDKLISIKAGFQF